MRGSAPDLPQECPTAPQAEERITVSFEGRDYPLLWEPTGWRMRSRSKSHPADYRTGVSNLAEAKRLCKVWLGQNKERAFIPKRGGGTLEKLAELYLTTPKKTKSETAKDNVSRLRSICRLVKGKELEEMTCREITPDFWQDYQRKALEAEGLEFNLVTRYRQNVRINAAVRIARCLFLKPLIRVYRAAGLDPLEDAGEAVMLPEPYVPPTKEDDAGLVKAWMGLHETDLRLWLTIGLARFAGLRREEINASRVGWIEVKDNVCRIALMDRPDEKFWTKTGKPYTAQIIRPELAEHLQQLKENGDALAVVVPDPPAGEDRDRWFERVPQKWLHGFGITAQRPLHRLRGLYADEVAKITADAVTARLAAIKEAQKNLGHTTSATTENHYLSLDALR